MDEKTCRLICDVENMFYDVHRDIRAIEAVALALGFSSEPARNAVTYVNDRLCEDMVDLEEAVNALVEKVKALKLGGEADAKG